MPGLLLGCLASYQTFNLQKWVEVEATIDSTFHKYNTVKKRRKTNGGPTKSRQLKSTEVRGTYNYVWQEKSYQSNEIALWQMSYPIGNRKIAELQSYLDNATLVKAYVNPENPQEAVLVRSIHNGILFFYLSGIATFLFLAAISSLLFKIPNHRVGIMCLLALLALYLWFFIYGGIDLTNCIEVIE